MRHSLLAGVRPRSVLAAHLLSWIILTAKLLRWKSGWVETRNSAGIRARYPLCSMAISPPRPRASDCGPGARADATEDYMAGLVQGKVALVTGGASGIGRATSLIFAREGARVAVSDLNLEGCEETVAMIKQAGGEAFSVRC